MTQPAESKDTISIKELQDNVDTTIRRAVDIKYDIELGLTGRDYSVVISRMAEGLERRDAVIEDLTCKLDEYGLL